jgi:iron complex outermembrane recepter protein
MARSIVRNPYGRLTSWTAIATSALLAAGTAYGQSELSAFSATAMGDGDIIAQATEGEARDEKPQPELEIENIVVSARKRNERVQRIPIAITALDQSSLEEIGANRIPLISPLIPNSSFTFQGGTAARLTIRGISEFDPQPAVDPAIGVYVDGVYQARIQSGQQALFDVDRIEVLRGPQGTIFGKNSLGGAINIATNAPTFDQEGDVSVKLGNYRLFETRATYNMPLAEDRLAARIALATNKRDGFERDTAGNDRDDDALLAGRFKLLYFPSETVELLFSFDQSKEQRVIAAAKCKLTTPVPVNDFQGALFALGFQDECAAVQNTSNERRVALNIDGSEDTSNRGSSFRATWALTPDVTLTSLTAWRSLDTINPYDADATTVNVFNESFDSEQDQYTQEFQLAGSASGGRLEYLVGLFALREHIDTKNPIGGFFPTVTAADVVNPFPITGDPAQDAQITADLLRGAAERSDQENDVQVNSIYGQIRYNLTDAVQFVGGLRFEADKRRIYKRLQALNDGPCTTSPAAVAGGTICSFYDRTERFTDYQPSASLSYRFSDSQLAYVSYAKGFKSGGFNARSLANDLGDIVALDGTVTPAIQDDVSFDPAQQTTYEIGTKSTFADGRLQVNAAAFYTVYDSVQALIASSFVPGNFAPGFGNQGDSIITGVELETLLLPLPNLRIGANFGFNDDRYTDFQEPSIGQSGVRKLGDQRLPFNSKYSYGVSADYLVDTQVGQVSFGAMWAGRSKLFFDPENQDTVAQNKYGVLTGRLGVMLQDGRTEITFIGTNLLDREYDAYGLDLTGFIGAAQVYKAAPRQYAVEVRRRF